jgi:hypothetical protein
MGYSLADEEPESVAITPIGAAPARLSIPLPRSYESDPRRMTVALTHDCLPSEGGM